MVTTKMIKMIKMTTKVEVTMSPGIDSESHRIPVGVSRHLIALCLLSFVIQDCLTTNSSKPRKRQSAVCIMMAASQKAIPRCGPSRVEPTMKFHMTHGYMGFFWSPSGLGACKCRS